MRVAHETLAFTVGVLALAGCGSEVVSGTGGAGTTTSSQTGVTTGSSSSATSSGSTVSSSSTGTFVQPGECKTNTDCPPDGQCVELFNGGYKVCQYPVPSATACSGSNLDQCCKDADCMGVGEHCLLSPVVAMCVGVQQEPHNVCAKDQCTTDTDCQPDEICAPPGALHQKIRTCLHAACKTTFCGQESLAPCVVLKSPCCDAPIGLVCGYGCTTDMDCPGGYCDVDPMNPTSTKCMTGSPACPL